MSLLEVQDLEVRYPLAKAVRKGGSKFVHAVRGVSFQLNAGETLGVVGESGCGKSSLAKCLVRLNVPAAGSVRFEGNDVFALSGPQLKSYRRSLQMVFQDPYGSLNPKLTVGASITEGMEIHGLWKDALQRRQEGERLLERVGLSAGAFDRFPHEFSGGQRQRIGVARALAVQPEVIVCDEPVSALDVSVQAQIVNLLADLQAESGVAFVFISHDLAVVEHLCHRIVVMYLGRVVEEGPANAVVSNPQHPYTKALIEAVPGQRRGNGSTRPGSLLQGEMPSPLAPPSGCAFHPRCPLVEESCRSLAPGLNSVGDDRRVACPVVAHSRVREARS